MRVLAATVLIVSVASAKEKLAHFQPEHSTPYFASGPAQAAAAELRLEEWGKAAKDFADYLKKKPHAADARQAQFVLAWAELKAGRFNDAAIHFDGLAKSYPLLADYLHAYGARAHLAAGRANEALARAKRVPPSSALDGDARLTRAESQHQLDKHEAAATEYAAYLEAYPQSYRVNEIRFRLAEELDAVGKSDEAKAQLRRVYLDAPESWGKQAESRLKDETFDAAELSARAMVLFDNMRNSESEASFLKVLTAPKVTDELTCVAKFHAAQSVFKQRDRSRAAPMFDAAVQACEKAKDEDLTTKSLYQGGRSWGGKGDKDKDPATIRTAAQRFERVWKEHPSHTYADDARLREAEEYDALKDDAKVAELLSGLPDAFPTGDQKGEALWRLAFRAWKKDDAAGAKSWLEKELAMLPREDGWWEAGRTLYWLGRVADKTGDAGAPDRYAQAAREYPLSYYSLMALTRLREKWPDKADALLDELTKDAPDAGWKFAPRKMYGEPGFQRGVELARLGLGPLASRELALSGIEVPKKRGETVSDPDKEDLLWLAAVLYDRAGEYSISHFIPRWILTAYSREWPVGEAHKKWVLSYPRAYFDLIDKNTKITGQPTALELAIVREESAFDPLMESFANAVGLTQLTPPPAARWANGLPHDRQALHDPAINVAIGCRELGALYKLYAGNPALTIAGYNAGEGAVNRWLKDPERANLATDEWIESIPYDETRGYTKRVLSSYFAYLWLEPGAKKAADRVPPIPLALPKKK
jgi:soluble lytic murein transglycosylase